MLDKNLNVENLNDASTDFLKEVLEELNKVTEKIKDRLDEKSLYSENELFYVYSYTPEKVYITRQGSKKLELLENVTEEFKKNLAEGFILRYRNGDFIVDEELTDKSMNFELDFDNYKEE